MVFDCLSLREAQYALRRGFFLVSDAVGNVKTRLSPNPKCNEPDESKQRSDEWNDQDETALCRPVVDSVVCRLPRVRQPAPPSRCLKAQTMANDTFPRRSRRNTFSERRPSETESHLLTASRLPVDSHRQASQRTSQKTDNSKAQSSDPKDGFNRQTPSSTQPPSHYQTFPSVVPGPRDSGCRRH
jgi:hypothetical protein